MGQHCSPIPEEPFSGHADEVGKNQLRARILTWTSEKSGGNTYQNFEFAKTLNETKDKSDGCTYFSFNE